MPTPGIEDTRKIMPKLPLKSKETTNISSIRSIKSIKKINEQAGEVELKFDQSPIMLKDLQDTRRDETRFLSRIQQGNLHRLFKFYAN